MKSILPDFSRLTLQARLLLATLVALGLAMVVFVLLYQAMAVTWPALLVALAAGFASATLLLWLLTRPVRLGLVALEQGLLNLLDNDFSVTLASSPLDELNRLVTSYNQLTESLRRDRQSLYQRELLLDTIIENASMAVLIVDHHRRVIFSNREAELCFHEGRALNGHKLEAVLADKNPELMTNIRRQQSGILPLRAGSVHLYHLFVGEFAFNAQKHTLVLCKEMTRELARQEADTWKKVIRIISHEINNSLAPISSLAHSGQLLVRKQQWQTLPEVFTTLAERADHLKTFVGGYAEVAKLPRPRKSPVPWAGFFSGLQLGYPFALASPLPEQPGYFDAAQVQQLLLNLLKNAAESGSPAGDIQVSITQSAHTSTLEVLDRGRGMPPEVLRNALLPFYSTKAGGSGVGLTLCREIVEAHGGELVLINRRRGGLRVRIVLPRSA